MSKKEYEMHIKKYIPHKFYGFVVDGFGMQVFFHLNCFEAEDEVPPIVGEKVMVQADLVSTPMRMQAQKAQSVRRVNSPIHLGGEVQSYDSERGYGFVLGEDGESYHLHKSEFVRNQQVYVGQKLKFYAGFRQGRPRACHVEVVDD